jgi:hypothetical protein
VLVEGEYAYIADGWGGLRVLFVANPASLGEVGFYDTANAVGVKKAGDFVFIADEQEGLLILRFLGLPHRAYMPLILRASR